MNKKINDELIPIIDGLSRKTGVNQRDVEKILLEIGLHKSLLAANEAISPDALSKIKFSDLIVGIKFGQVMVHA